MKINTRQLKQIIKETVTNVLKESQGLKSQKLYSILKQHGGFDISVYRRGKHGAYSATTDWHNKTDEEIIGVISKEQLRDIQEGHDVDGDGQITLDLKYGQEITEYH